jgi:Transposase DDE domain
MGGREITLVTNDLKSSARTIAALYKARWQVELYFKWLKQNLKLGHFLGTSRNAVTIQIMAALIAYLLVRIAATRHLADGISLQAITRLMPAAMLTRRPFADLLAAPPKPPPMPNSQLELAYA